MKRLSLFLDNMLTPSSKPVIDLRSHIQHPSVLTPIPDWFVNQHPPSNLAWLCFLFVSSFSSSSIRAIDVEGGGAAEVDEIGEAIPSCFTKAWHFIE